MACSDRIPPPIPGTGADAEAPRRGGTLRLASFQDIQTLDPAGPNDGLSLEAEHLVFAGLIDMGPDGRPVPDLADRWSVEDEGRSYRFVLRPGLSFQDGAELTAADVKRSVERALHPTTPNPNASYFAKIVGYDAYASGRADHLAGVVVHGRDEVEFALQAPDATFLPMLAMHTLRPVCRTAGDRYDAQWIPCGAGPFALAPGGWERGARLRLVRNPRYHRPGLPRLDGVSFSFHMPPLSQRLRFEAGELDVVNELAEEDARRLAADPRWSGLSSAGADVRVYGESMNTRMPPFDNIEVRRAVAAAIDREHIRLLRPASIRVLSQLVPPSVPGFDPNVVGQHHDLAAALEHMRKAGYAYDPTTGRGGFPDVIDYPLYDQGLLVETAQLLAQDLARIGLRIALRLMSWQAFLALQERPGGAALSQANWEMDYPDPSSFFDPLFTTAAIGPEGSHNTAFYSNPLFDEIVARAHGEGDPLKRRALYHRADDILCDDAPWAFAYTTHSLTFRQGYVRGYVTHRLWPLDATEVWIDRAGAAPDGEREGR